MYLSTNQSLSIHISLSISMYMSISICIPISTYIYMHTSRTRPSLWPCSARWCRAAACTGPWGSPWSPTGSSWAQWDPWSQRPPRAAGRGRCAPVRKRPVTAVWDNSLGARACSLPPFLVPPSFLFFWSLYACRFPLYPTPSYHIYIYNLSVYVYIYGYPTDPGT